MAARRRNRSNSRRRKRPRRGPRARRATTVKLLFQGLLVTLVGIACINGLVRAVGGGDPHLLSPRFLGDKSHALAALVLHGLAHVVGGDHPPAAPVLRAAAREHGIPPQLAVAVARAESSFDPHAISRTGAMGLMQLMPSTARAMGVSDPFDSEHNARGGARYLGQLLKRYGGALPRAVAAYNAGPGRVPLSGRSQLPPETRAYVHAVLGHDLLWATR